MANPRLRDTGPEIALSQELADSLAVDEERRLVEALDDIRTLRDAINHTKKSLAEEELPVRQWLERKGGELVDGEKGWRAYLQEGLGWNYEKAQVIAERDPSLYRRLVELGCLLVDPKAVEQALQKGWLTTGDVERWRVRVVRTTTLQVVKA